MSISTERRETFNKKETFYFMCVLHHSMLVNSEAGRVRMESVHDER